MVHIVDFTFDSIHHLKDLSFTRQSIKSDLQIIAKALFAFLLLPIAAPISLFAKRHVVVIGKPNRISVVSYNILVPHWAANEKPCLANEPWHVRCKRLVGRFSSESPDVVALQEVEQFKDIEREMKKQGYSGIFTSRNNGEEEGLAVFYKKAKLKVVSQKPLFFNDGSGRLVQKVTFKNQLNQEFTLFNTHIRYSPDENLQKVEIDVVQEAVVHEKNPHVVCGDFTQTPQKGGIQSLKSGGLVDSLEQQQEGSFFMPGDDTNGRRIDYIFTSQNITLLSAKVLGEAIKLPTQEEPSDHLPISAVLEL
jgi:endonuclease/exonuclease/phosphatase family metal-dependent hydrolase